VRHNPLPSGMGSINWIRRLISWAKRPNNPDLWPEKTVEDLRPFMRHDKPEPRYVELRSVSANSPRRQPCEKCGRSLPRNKKKRSGSIVEYYCPSCNLVMMLSLRQKRRQSAPGINRKRRRWGQDEKA